MFPLGKVLGRFAEFVAGVPILLGAAYLFHAPITWRTLVALPLAVILQFALLAGIALLLSAATVMLRDVERFVRLVVRVLFYAAPIIYPLSQVKGSETLPDWAKTLYVADPLVGIFQLHHAAWFPEEFPSAGLLVTTFVGCALVLLAGIVVFRRLEPSVLKEL
jgi:ABC-2 type transport system permease protein